MLAPARLKRPLAERHPMAAAVYVDFVFHVLELERPSTGYAICVKSEVNWF